MVYNLREWLLLQFPSLYFSSNGFQTDSPDDATEINEGSGEDQSLYTRQDDVIQFVSRATAKPTARKNAVDVYNYIRKKFGCVFPSVTVDGVLYPEVTAWAIRPINKPQYIGNDDNGRPEFSYSVEITTTLEQVQ